MNTYEKHDKIEYVDSDDVANVEPDLTFTVKFLIFTAISLFLFLLFGIIILIISWL
jgi:hypothetical protein